MILPLEKLGQITRFGAKFIVVHQQHLRYFGDHHTLWLSLDLNSPFMNLLLLKLQSNIIMMY